MRIDQRDTCIQYYGRWSVEECAAITTAPGAFFQIAFIGSQIVLHFDTYCMSEPHPQLWLSLDGGNRFETPVERHIQIQAAAGGRHVLTVIFKSAKSIVNRWFWPLDARAAFMGFDADDRAELTSLRMKALEFLGDSITEGALADVEIEPEEEPLLRPYQNDAMASFAWLTAWRLHRVPILAGYSSVGVTQNGLGGVPCAKELYPYCYHGTRCSADTLEVEAVILNYGENDRRQSGAFAERYLELLQLAASRRPNARLILLQPFGGGYRAELEQLQQLAPVTCIWTEGWYQEAELHPSRQGHIHIAGQLT